MGRLLDEERLSQARPSGSAGDGSDAGADEAGHQPAGEERNRVAAEKASLAVGARVMIRGVAWSGDTGPVKSVDVSTDTGRTWKPASLARGQETKFGWRQWEFAWTPESEAYYTIMARARDETGNTQPFAQGWNPSGYGWNVVPRVSVAVGVPARAAAAAVEAPKPESAELKPPVKCVTGWMSSRSSTSREANGIARSPK